MARKRVAEPVAHDDKGWPIYGYNTDGKPVCFACKKTGQRCMATLRHKNGRCRVHGGAVPGGQHHHNYRTGQYARSGLGIGQLILQASMDEDYLSGREEIAISTAEIIRTMEQFDKGLDPDTWGRVRRLTKDIKDQLNSDKVGSTIEAFGEKLAPFNKLFTFIQMLMDALDSASSEESTFNRLRIATEHRRKLVETELKREQMQRNSMPADQVIVLIQQMTDSVMKCFASDPTGLRAFALELDQLPILLPANKSKSGVLSVQDTLITPDEIEASIASQRKKRHDQQDLAHRKQLGLANGANVLGETHPLFGESLPESTDRVKKNIPERAFDEVYEVAKRTNRQLKCDIRLSLPLHAIVSS